MASGYCWLQVLAVKFSLTSKESTEAVQTLEANKKRNAERLRISYQHFPGKHGELQMLLYNKEKVGQSSDTGGRKGSGQAEDIPEPGKSQKDLCLSSAPWKWKHRLLLSHKEQSLLFFCVFTGKALKKDGFLKRHLKISFSPPLSPNHCLCTDRSGHGGVPRFL